MSSPKQMTHSDIPKMFDEAFAHHRAGRLQDADKIYRHILSLDPKHADSLHLLGTLAHRGGHIDAAIVLMRQAIDIRGDIDLYHNNLANALKDKSAFDEASDHYNCALKLNPQSAEAHYNLGCLLRDQGKRKAAIAHFKQAIALRPQLIAAYVNLGNVIKSDGRVDEAIKHYEGALAIDPTNADAHYNLATALKDQNKFDEAEAHYKKALAAKPNYVEAYNNLGVLMQDQSKIDAAFGYFRKAISIRPEHVESQVNEAMIHLLRGDMAEGWKQYEWRHRMKGIRPFKTDKPVWNGQDLVGKTILLLSEQGLGDSLQFVRYAALVKKRGARVLLQCPTALARLFNMLPCIDQIIPEGEVAPEHDFYASLLSLPAIFGTELKTIPHEVPYLFPDTGEIKAWASRLGSVAGKKIGLVWAGQSRPDHPNANAVDQRRSISLTQLALLGNVPGVQFFSLQKGEPAKQLEMPPPGLSVIDTMDHVKDFADTAALVSNLDMVIGVDTSVIHLAGALGKPVWALSRFDGCWRWLLDREDSPWYPSLRLFRQHQSGHWPSVIEDVRRALEKL